MNHPLQPNSHEVAVFFGFAGVEELGSIPRIRHYPQPPLRYPGNAELLNGSGATSVKYVVVDSAFEPQRRNWLANSAMTRGTQVMYFNESEVRKALTQPPEPQVPAPEPQGMFIPEPQPVRRKTRPFIPARKVLETYWEAVGQDPEQYSEDEAKAILIAEGYYTSHAIRLALGKFRRAHGLPPGTEAQTELRAKLASYRSAFKAGKGVSRYRTLIRRLLAEHPWLKQRKI